MKIKKNNRISHTTRQPQKQMSKIEISERTATLINRSLIVSWDKFKAEGERIRHNQKCFEQALDSSPQSENYKQMNVLNGLFIVYEFDFNYYHGEECGEYEDCDVIVYTDDCACEKEVNYIIKIKKSDTTIFQLGFSKKQTREEVVDAFGEMPTEFTLCQCGQVADKAGNWCEDCFVWRREHPNGGTEVCAICHEGEGKYMKTDCGHYFHTHCFHKVECKRVGLEYVKQCPLCRHSIDNKKTEYCI